MPRIEFKGKQMVYHHHMLVPFHELREAPAKSVLGADGKLSLNDNVIIHGDNLKALKTLVTTHHRKIKCIYIDPPYNTGNEGWVYNDRVDNPMMQEWLGKVVDKEDQTRHDKWLAMMWPRLELMHELLRDDGVIFISIDDNEVHRLRMMMDEIFGEENFVAKFVWRRTDNQSNLGNIATVKEYILCYSNGDDIKLNKIDLLDTAINEYRYEDEFGKFRRGIVYHKTRGRHFYEIVTPNGNILSGPFMIKEEEFNELRSNNGIYWAGGKTELPYTKIYLENSKGQIISDLLSDTVGTNQQASIELESIFNERIFDFPKPTSLINLFIKIATNSNSNDMILDCFAGSGTSAHAVLALNHQDGGNRKFILVESESYCDSITAERVRRVITGIPTAKKEELRIGTGGSFSYFELGEELESKAILTGDTLPSYNEFAKYLFFMATFEVWRPAELDRENYFIGESDKYKVYLFYEPNLDYLRGTALNLPMAETLPRFKYGDKPRLVFAPTKYLDQEYLDRFGIVYLRLPYEVYDTAAGHLTKSNEGNNAGSGGTLSGSKA